MQTLLKYELKESGVIRILHLEDNSLDSELVCNLLDESGLKCEITNVRTRAEFHASLHAQPWHMILSDFALPSFDGLTALEIAKQLCPSTPFIFVTGTMGEENAIESLKNGATDYVLKQNLARLPSAVCRSLKERVETLHRMQAEAELHISQEQIRFLAYHDALTRLPNRAFLLDRLVELLAHARRHGEHAGFLFIDLDHFKLVNDSLGHSMGDLLLQSVADRLNATARVQDIVARLGGDEFVVVLRGIKDPSDAAMAADRIQRVIAEEIVIENYRLVNTCSIGISVFPGNGDDAETLIQNADAALYAAKEAGRNTWQFFTPEMNQKAVERLTLETALRHALRDGQLYLEYQPQVETPSGRIVGTEALVRWRHPELGMVPPSIFVPIAENTGEIIQIGDWVLRTACAQAREWQRAGLPPLIMAVNVSAVQFRNPAFLGKIHQVLEETGLPPSCLELEVTEGQMMENPETMMVLLREITTTGLGLAIDDFGIGYCGLSYLRHFQFSRLKIDRSFVGSVLAAPRDAALTAVIVNMARALKMKVIAECVETAEQVKFLQQIGCQEFQGYYFSRPVSASQFERLLATG